MLIKQSVWDEGTFHRTKRFGNHVEWHGMTFNGTSPPHCTCNGNPCNTFTQTSCASPNPLPSSLLHGRRPILEGKHKKFISLFDIFLTPLCSPRQYLLWYLRMYTLFDAQFTDDTQGYYKFHHSIFLSPQGLKKYARNE